VASSGVNMENEGQKYDLIAKGFSDMRDSFATEQKYLDLFLEYLKSMSTILDVGYGSGFPIASYLIDKGFQVTGVDASKELLKIAKVKTPQMKQIYGDVRNVNIIQKFDGILEWWCPFTFTKKRS
jgi:2-polyprenyl-3-methyl-5-hydroxy-6-metoxy-1,4-benzoquinol methylase